MQNGERLSTLTAIENEKARPAAPLTIVATEPLAHAHCQGMAIREERVSIPFQYAHLAIARLDGNMQFLQANQTFARLVSFTVEQLVGGMTWFDVAPSHSTVTARRQLLADMKRSQDKPLEVAHILQGGNGAMAEVMTTFEPQWSEDGLFNGASVLVFDLTMQRAQERELEEELEKIDQMKKDLMRAQSLASLGALVASVAEEILTPLRKGIELGEVIEASALSLSEDLEPHFGEASKPMQLTKRLDRGAHCMVQQLQDVVRLVGNFKKMAVDRSTSMIRRFSLANLLNEIVTTQTLIVRDRVRFEIQADADLIMQTYPGELEQVLSSLLENACYHAFPGKHTGTIFLIAKKVATQEKVSLSVIDNGIGMAPNVAEHVFDPFFTTRGSTGKGGLGLHIVHNLVTRQLKGHISLISRAGEGTEFNLIIPQNIATP